jgi:dihydroxyacetone kinase DhaKLM complex PTS-EIIA-like component DhaM
MAQLNQQKFQLSTSMGKDNSKLLRTTLEYLNEVIDACNEDDDAEALRDAWSDIEAIQTVFERKKAEISDEMQRLQGYVKTLDSYFKGAESPGAQELLDEDCTELPSPLRPYHLFGLIISPTEFCFRRVTQSEEMLVDIGDCDGSVNSKDEWYRVCYTSALDPIVSRITEEDAVSQAKLGSADFSWQEVIAIYANDYALNTNLHDLELSPALKKFVHLDKNALYSEVVQYHDRQESPDIVSRLETPNESESFTEDERGSSLQ